MVLVYCSYLLKSNVYQLFLNYYFSKRKENEHGYIRPYRSN
nr:MAG TPA: hypothetical protein [Caudoviricetes sp.]